MTKLARFVSISLPLLLCLPGCFMLPAEDPYEDPGNPRQLTVNWTLRNVDGSTAPCPAGFEGLILGWTPDTDSVGFTDLLPCQSTGSFTRTLYTTGIHEWEKEPNDDLVPITPLSPHYSVWVIITDSTGGLNRAQSIETRVDLATGDQTINIDIYPDGGFGTLGWSFWSTITGEFAPSCAAVGVDTIEYRYRPFADETAPLTVEQWPCTARDEIFPGLGDDFGSGRTRALAPGDYVGDLVAIRGGVDVGIEPEIFLSIKDGNAVYERYGLTIDIPDR